VTKYPDWLLAGAVLTVFPLTESRTVSLGCFIEHDSASARLRIAADVIQMHSGSYCHTNDVGFVIPQTTLPGAVLQELTVKLGKILLAELYIGFFGVDVVVFPNTNPSRKKVKPPATLPYPLTDLPLMQHGIEPNRNEWTPLIS
jgi:hypothetical protein